MLKGADAFPVAEACGRLNDIPATPSTAICCLSSLVW
jgi:hypothetical protein